MDINKMRIPSPAEVVGNRCARIYNKRRCATKRLAALYKYFIIIILSRCPQRSRVTLVGANWNQLVGELVSWQKFGKQLMKENRV